MYEERITVQRGHAQNEVVRTAKVEQHAFFGVPDELKEIDGMNNDAVDSYAQ